MNEQATASMPLLVFVGTFLISQLSAAAAWIVVVAALNPTIVAAAIGAIGQVTAAVVTWYLLSRSRKDK